MANILSSLRVWIHRRGSGRCGESQERKGGGHAGAGVLRRMMGDRRGVIAALTAVTMLMVTGMVGLAIDVGLWYRLTRSMQNAADAAAMAAAQDAVAATRDSKTSTWASTGTAVAANYGFVNSQNNSTVSVTTVTCPSGSGTCYKAAITQQAPRLFSSIFLGTSTLATNATVSPISGNAIHQYCLLALAHSGSPATGILADGVPSANMTGCAIMSNTDMTCNGHNLLATWGDAAGTNGGSAGCGNIQNSNVAAVSDPYSSLATNIPANTCGGSYPGVTWSSNQTLGATKIICGNLTLTSDVTLTTASPGSVLVIENGYVNSNGHTLSNDYVGANGLTVVFSGPSGTTAGALGLSGSGNANGTFQIIAPTSGPWSGIAVYQDPALTTSQSLTYAGSSPTWDITGAVYMPYVSLTFKGAAGKSNNGAACFVLVANDVTFKGTGSIESNGQCAAAGLAMPQDTISGQPALVQ